MVGLYGGSDENARRGRSGRKWRRGGAGQAGDIVDVNPLLLLGLGLGLLDQADERLDLADRLGAAPHQHPVNVPVATLKRAALEMVNGFAKNQGACREGAIDERLAADVNG